MLGVERWTLNVSAISCDRRLWLIRAMATIVAATVAAPPMVFRCEHHQAVVEIEFTGPKSWPGVSHLLGAMKFHDAIPAQARFVASFCRNPREQLVGNGHRLAPARTFVGGGGAEAAIIWPAAQRTTLRGVVRRRTGGIMAIVSHENQARLWRATMSAPMPRNASESVVGSGTATSASISALPPRTSMRTNSTLPSRTLWPRPSCAQEMS